jgi:ribosomal protein RSM22 (predicted rRNA methylase)
MNPLYRILESLADSVKPAELKAAYETMSQAYRAGDKIVLKDSIMQLAYIQARMPATVAVLSSVFAHLKAYESTITTLLDLGSGPASVLWAAQGKLLSLKHAVCVDQSKGLLDLGKTMLEQSDSSLEIIWLNERLGGNVKSSLEAHGQKSFDLVTMSYVLNELPEDKRGKVLQDAWAQADGYLVLVEPGTPQGFQNIRDARDLLIRDGAQIVAPCTHENVCPMSQEDWCHFSVRLQRSKVHQSIKGALAYEDEKYSYVIATKRPLSDRPAARIVKKPLESKGLVELDLCDANGLSRGKISKRQKDVFKLARKAGWGDGWGASS